MGMVVEMVKIVMMMMINDQWHHDHDHWTGLPIGRKASSQDQRRSELGGVENIKHIVLARRTICHYHGHLHWTHGALLHGGPPEEQAAAGAGMGRTLRL